MTRILAIGLATNIDDRAKNWVKGMESAGIDYKLLGTGEKFTGWKMRSESYQKEMLYDTDTDIFIISDVYDVLVNQNVVEKIKESGKTVVEHILSTFYEFNKPIVVGVEKPCFTNCYDFSLTSVFNILGEQYIYPNGGMLIGYRTHLIQLYQHLEKFKDDQVELGKIVKEYPNIFGYDLHSKLFYNFFVEPAQQRFDSALLIHFPGQNFSIAANNGYNLLADTPVSPTTGAPHQIKFCIIVVFIVLFITIFALSIK